jgi:hypothetical protein
VSEIVARSSLHFFQSKLHKRLTNLDIPVYSVTKGIKLLREHVSSNYGDDAFVILDDPDDVDQIKELLSVQNSLSTNSLILIASQRKAVLTDAGVEESSIYNLTGPNGRQSQELFCSRAFNQPHPLPEFENLVYEFLTVLNELPSAEKVYGALFHGKLNKSYWDWHLERPEEPQETSLPYDIEKAKSSCGLYGKAKDLEKVVSLQQQRGELQVVGVVGLGGQGKTTLAKEFFGRKCSYYRYSCFLHDVGKRYLLPLLSKLLKGWTQLNLQVESVDEGTELFKKHVSSFKSLVILDNVVHSDPLDELLSVLSVLTPDSLILITSREKDVLERSGVKAIYELNGLDSQDSQELFCLHAFSRRHPLPGFNDLVDKYSAACNGLPLTLKVCGALLCGKTERSYWQYHLDRLQQSPNDIQKILTIGYDGLTIEDRRMFLYLANCCTRVKSDLVERLWNRGLMGLQERCLVEVDSEGFIIMPEHLRDLGKSIVEALPRTLWLPTGNNPHLLQQSSNEQVITELRRSSDDLLRQLSVLKEVRGFMIIILVMMMAMTIWNMGRGC